MQGGAIAFQRDAQGVGDAAGRSDLGRCVAGNPDGGVACLAGGVLGGGKHRTAISESVVQGSVADRAAQPHLFAIGMEILVADAVADVPREGVKCTVLGVVHQHHEGAVAQAGGTVAGGQATE